MRLTNRRVSVLVLVCCFAGLPGMAAMAGDHIFMGNLLLEAGRLDEAEEHYDRALKTIESSSLAQPVKDQAWLTHLFNTARVAAARGEIDKATTMANDYRERVEMAENRHQIRLAHQLLGTIALKSCDFETARQELLQTNQLNPYNIYRLAMAYEGLNQTEKAMSLYQKAANYNVVNNIDLAFIRSKTGDKRAMM